MRYLARHIDGTVPRWYSVQFGWGDRHNATVFNSGEEAARVINGDLPFEEGISYCLEVFGGFA